MSLWDGSGVEVALLDRSGVIVAVNPAWEAFCADNGGDPTRCGVGVSYPQICAQDAEDLATRTVADAIGDALAGELPAALRVPIACDAPDEPRSYDVLVSSRYDDSGECVGATVTLSRVVAGIEPGGAGDEGDDLGWPPEPYLVPPPESDRVRRAAASPPRWVGPMRVPAEPAGLEQLLEGIVERLFAVAVDLQDLARRVRTTGQRDRLVSHVEAMETLIAGIRAARFASPEAAIG